MASIGIFDLVFKVPIDLTDFHLVRNNDCGFQQCLKLLDMRFRPFSLIDHFSVPGVLLSNRDKGESKNVAIKVALVWGAASGIAA
jgi:hypothetical protein